MRPKPISSCSWGACLHGKAYENSEFSYGLCTRMQKSIISIYVGHMKK